MSFFEVCRAIFTILFGKRSLLGPAVLMNIVGWIAFSRGYSIAASFFFLFGLVLVFLNSRGFRQELPPEYQVGSKLNGVDDDPDYEMYWEIVEIASDRKKASIRMAYEINGQFIKSNLVVAYSSFFILNQFRLQNERASISA